MRDIREEFSLLFRFFFNEGRTLMHSVATGWDTARTRSDGTRVFAFDRAALDGYNARYQDLKARLHGADGATGTFTARLLVPLFLVRIACVCAAAMWSAAWTLAFGLLQLVIAPYSFVAGVASWFLVLPDDLMHYVDFAILQGATAVLFYGFPILADYFKITIGWEFIAAWIVLDQLLCAVFCFVWTPLGPPIRYPWRRVLVSIPYGFLNCKTYWLILLLCLRGMKLDLLAIGLYALLPRKTFRYTLAFCRRLLPRFSLHELYPATMFYHAHRLAHLPGVYSQSHRHHHHLHDSTPFDANMYGSGHAEEWLRLATEIGVSLVTGLVPHSLSPRTMYGSIINAAGHTRVLGEKPLGGNFHVDHHTHYQRNFGIVYPPVDLLLGTEHGDVSSMGSTTGNAYVCTKKVERNAYILEIRKESPPAAGVVHQRIG